MNVKNELDFQLKPRCLVAAESSFSGTGERWEIHCKDQRSSSSDPDVRAARELYAGVQKAGSIYVLDTQSRRAVCLLSASQVHLLDCRPAGEHHVAFALGSLVWDALAARPDLCHPSGVLLDVSALAGSSLVKNWSSFFVGLRHRSASPKLAKLRSDEGQKSGSQTDSSQQVTVWIVGLEADRLEGALQEADALVQGMLLTRSLVNAPPNFLTPSRYEQFVSGYLSQLQTAAARFGGTVQMSVLKGAELDDNQCRLIQAVGKGSADEPRILRLQFRRRGHPSDGGAALPQVTLVGKGITFDSGGYNLKPSGAMRNMKKDMGGSAAALGVFASVVLSDVAVDCDCYLALAENMVSGSAMRPGDVYKARDGALVEIDNTDAEGRLVLADVLHLAAAYQPDYLLDFATLTGAARVALGPDVDALFANDKGLRDALVAASEETGDWVWPLPLVDSYRQMLESSVGDVVNSPGSGLGGAITAAMFLARFVGKTRWAHIDTYMWADGTLNLAAGPTGPSGKCVRLIHHWLKDHVASSGASG
jgi:leucyl aminopeptidase